MTPLLDVNALVALIDSKHVFHVAARRWFASLSGEKWATCPIVQNGAMRVMGQRSYPNYPGSFAVAAEYVRAWCALPGHEFWPDDVTLLDPDLADVAAITSPDRVTDTYLLALATSRGGRLATFDRRLQTLAVAGGAGALLLLDS